MFCRQNSRIKCGIHIHFYNMWIRENYDIAKQNTSTIKLSNLPSSLPTYLSIYLPSLQVHSLSHFYWIFVEFAYFYRWTLKMKLNLSAVFFYMKTEQVNYIMFSNMVWSVFNIHNHKWRLRRRRSRWKKTKARLTIWHIMLVFAHLFAIVPLFCKIVFFFLFVLYLLVSR